MLTKEEKRKHCERINAHIIDSLKRDGVYKDGYQPLIDKITIDNIRELVTLAIDDLHPEYKIEVVNFEQTTDGKLRFSLMVLEIQNNHKDN